MLENSCEQQNVSEHDTKENESHFYIWIFDWDHQQK